MKLARRRSGLRTKRTFATGAKQGSRGSMTSGAGELPLHHPRATAAPGHTSPALPPRPILPAAITSKDNCASREGEMLGKIFAPTLASVCLSLAPLLSLRTIPERRLPALCAASSHTWAILAHCCPRCNVRTQDGLSLDPKPPSICRQTASRLKQVVPGATLGQYGCVRR